MAAPASGPTSRPLATDVITRLLTDTSIQAYVQQLRERMRRIVDTENETTDLQDGDYAYDSVAHILVSAVNGTAELPEQKVNVEYLRNEQRLVIPLALGMHWAPSAVVQGRAEGNVVLRNRYWAATRATYADLKQFVTPDVRAAELRAYLQNLDSRVNAERFTGWNQLEWYTNAEGDVDPEGTQNIVMSMVSLALQFNCDIRDFGFLNTPESYVTDDAWKTAGMVPLDRTLNKVKGLTLLNIAALNYESVGKVALSAWVRSYGVGMGLLPAVGSASVREFMFTSHQVTPEARLAVQQFERQYERPIISLCANILALFGLFHLAKDHTFRTADPNMLRIGMSYIMALRTDTTMATIDYMKLHQESIVRTASHPFGLAQTYWLAMVMSAHGRLMLPLMCRTDVTPPPVQRLMIIDAAAREWDGIPAGKQGSLAYTVELETIRAEIARIKANPPAFSGLHALYGIAQQDVPSDASLEAVKALMPCVYGFIMITHVDEKDGRDGLGYAMSLKNVQRDARGNVMTWEHAWENYISGIDRLNLVDVFRQIAVERGVLPPVEESA